LSEPATSKPLSGRTALVTADPVNAAAAFRLMKN
jgi:hypothetical protein